MTGQGWTLRDICSSDADLLANFCCSADGSDHSFEVEQWIRTSVVRWVVETTEPSTRPGGLLLVEGDAGQPIAVSAFEPGHTLVIDGVHVSSVRVQVIAVGNNWQDNDDDEGVRFSSTILTATLDRIELMWPGQPITAIVDGRNGKSSTLFRRAGFTVEMPHPTRTSCNLFIRPPM